MENQEIIARDRSLSSQQTPGDLGVLGSMYLSWMIIMHTYIQRSNEERYGSNY